MRIFVYGTLRPSLYPGRRPQGAVVENATYDGKLRMVNLGSFPALQTCETDHRIVGETFELPDIRVYDAYEGYRSDGKGLYDRKEIEIAVGPDGRKETAWVYFQHAGGKYSSGYDREIESGDWAQR